MGSTGRSPLMSLISLRTLINVDLSNVTDIRHQWPRSLFYISFCHLCQLSIQMTVRFRVVTWVANAFVHTAEHALSIKKKETTKKRCFGRLLSWLRGTWERLHWSSQNSSILLKLYHRLSKFISEFKPLFLDSRAAGSELFWARYWCLWSYIIN